MLSGHLVNGTIRPEAKKNEFSLIIVTLGFSENLVHKKPVSCMIGKLVA